jgi:hypothetical protein
MKKIDYFISSFNFYLFLMFKASLKYKLNKVLLKIISITSIIDFLDSMFYPNLSI